MTPSHLPFVTLDVFTSQRFLGNPLGLVRIPKDLQESPSQAQKQTVAREFNLSETVFLHEGDIDEPITIDIFATSAELPFAGHPTIGSGWYLLTQNPAKDQVILRTKAGDIPVRRVPGGKVQLQVPIDFKVHTPYNHPRMKGFQPKLKEEDFVNGVEGVEPVASIVKGMTFILLQLSSEESLSRLQPSSESLSIPDLGDWAGFVGLYAFYEREDGVVRTRMFDGTLEDPATGSAASTLAGWLAQGKGPGLHKLSILQGVEMGRRSNIEVAVKVGEDGQIKEIFLSGEAVEVMEGFVNH